MMEKIKFHISIFDWIQSCKLIAQAVLNDDA